MAINPVGATGATPAAERVNERIQPPAAHPLPPVKPTENHQGADTNATGNKKRDGQSSLGGQTTASTFGSISDIKRKFQDAEHDLEEMLEKVNRRLSFRLHEGADRMMVQVIDNKTNEVVREVPPEKFLDAITKMREYIGLLFDDWF